ncbi:AidA/PixA family protein [Pandoraea pnomenusa]|uniref:AidA/PixA family protein n=1 Tax=Pandoraea pnomenusa TaxID=93220 RepID=UPI00333FB178
MSHAKTPDAGTAADVLIVIDTVTLLDAHSGAADAAVDVDGSGYYAVAPGGEALEGVSGAPWRIDVSPGDCVRLRWTPLAMRGEHAVLLLLSLTDDAPLSALQQHVNTDATRYVPQSAAPEQPVPRPALDAYWQADVVASGSTSLQVEATVTDRDAAVIGRFRWLLPIVVP